MMALNLNPLLNGEGATTCFSSFIIQVFFTKQGTGYYFTSYTCKNDYDLGLQVPLNIDPNSVLASHPAGPGSIPGIPKIYIVAKVKQWCCCLEQWTTEAE